MEVNYKSEFGDFIIVPCDRVTFGFGGEIASPRPLNGLENAE
jgi:hypothetical protein